MSSYDSNSFIKIETVTKHIADVFGIPIGVKVIGISEASYISTGLKINDIIVKVSGKPISSINEFNTAINNLSAEEFLTYTVYRNGSYQVVNPYDVEE
jgi:serine protease Do